MTWVETALMQRHSGSEARRHGGAACWKRHGFGGALMPAGWVNPLVSCYWVRFDKWQTHQAASLLHPQVCTRARAILADSVGAPGASWLGRLVPVWFR
jgi:hypothetical protein